MSKVAITKCNGYELDKAVSAIRVLMENTDFPQVSGKDFLIKTNLLSDAKPEKGITTNPIIIEALIILLKERGANKIAVGDSPGLQTPNFKPIHSGILEIIEKTGTTWVDFTKETIEKRVYKKTKAPISKAVLDADILISAAKFKTHELMNATGASKNMFGIIPSIHKSKLHLSATSPDSFASLILNLLDIRKPDWSIIDAVIGMEGSGPANGNLRHIGLLMASNNPLQLDDAERIIMGYKKEDIPILRAAIKRDDHALDSEYTLLDPNGLVIQDFEIIKRKRKKGLFSSLLLPFLRRPFAKRGNKRPKPKFDKDKCRLCKRCIEICPARALSIKDGTIDFKIKKCISCYCCSEVCPFGAISIKE